MEKYKQYEHVLNRFDDNRDGKISPSELQVCVESIGGEIELADAEAAVLLMDSDGDGLLGLQDFVRVLDGVTEDEKVRDLREAFKMYVMDGCECITPKSLKRTLSMLGVSKTIDECEVMIARFDLNGDGVLDFDEFKVMMMC